MAWSTLFFDDFNRADSSTVGNGWTQTNYSAMSYSGVVNNKLSITSSGDFWFSNDNAGWVHMPAPTTNRFRISAFVDSSKQYDRSLMIRESLASNSAMITTCRFDVTNLESLLWRDTTGVTANWTGGSPNTSRFNRLMLEWNNGTAYLIESTTGSIITQRSFGWTPGFIGVASGGSNNGTKTAEDFRLEVFSNSTFLMGMPV